MENSQNNQLKNRKFDQMVTKLVKKPSWLNTMKIISIILAIVYIFRLFNYDYFVRHLSNAVKIIPNPWLLRGFIILRGLTQGSLLVSILNPFFKNRSYRIISGYIAPIITITNLILIKVYAASFLGPNYTLTDFRVIQFIIESGLILILSAMTILDNFKNLPKIETKWYHQGLIALGILGLVALTTLENFTMLGMFGEINDKAVKLSLVHRIYIYLSFIIPLVIYFVMRKRKYEDRYLLTLTISLGSVMMYFYHFAFSSYTNVSSWPFHLCNTAIILMAIAFIFRSKTFFYFNYFINVLGAFCAILMPNTTGNAFSIGSLHFWSNHWVAFFLPLLGVALKIFPRPNFKMITKAIIVFTIYFIVMAIINSWFTNYDPNVNYFFLNDDFLAKKLPFALELRNQHIIVFEYFGLKFITYPLYWLYIYFGFIILTFLTWLAYDAGFKVSDGLFELHALKRQKKLAIASRKNEILINKNLDNGGTNNMIKVEHFTKRYHKSNRNAVEDLNLEIKAGEIFGFLGHNGAGKSTFIKSLVGIQSISSGRILVNGFDVATQSLQTKQLIGYVPDNHAIYERLTGREYVNYIADLYLVSQEDRIKRLEKYLKMFDLEEAVDRQIKSYSHGMKQKITVIAALIHNPKVWILDEPLTGLDPKSAYQIKECMKEHASAGNVVFFSSHIIEVVENVCDRIAIIRGGKLMLTSTLKELKEQGVNLEQLFLKYVNATNEELAKIQKEASDV